MLKSVLGILCCVAAAHAPACFGVENWQSSLERDHSMVGKVFSLNTQREITVQELFDTLRESRVVLVGEKHDNPDHHVIEQKIVTALSGQATAVVMEMLDDSQSPHLEHVKPQDSGLQLRAKLAWDDRGWPWERYGSLVEQVVSSGLTLITGNLSRAQVKTIYQGGADALTADTRLASALHIPEEIKQTLLTELYEQHCKMMPREALVPMLNIQLARDARLAHAVIQSNTTPVILIAGAYHVRKDSAVPLHLQQLNVNDVVVLMLMEVDSQVERYDLFLKEHTAFADYIWFTPRFTNRDYCEDFKRNKS